MNPWPFIIGSYVVGIGGTCALIACAWLAMRRAESQADRIGRDE
jgi:hypothetical protein